MRKKPKFYTDEHVANSVVKGLRLRGIDVLTTKEAEMLKATDEEHLAFTNKEGRVIFTQDEDFLRLHAEAFEHSGSLYAPAHVNWQYSQGSRFNLPSHQIRRDEESR